MIDTWDRGGGQGGACGFKEPNDRVGSLICNVSGSITHVYTYTDKYKMEQWLLPRISDLEEMAELVIASRAR